MKIVETTVWVDLLNNESTQQTEWLADRLSVFQFGLFDLALCEVLQGMKVEKDFLATRDYLLRFEVLPTGGSSLAIQAAQNYRYLRSRGITVRKTIDCLIATACIQGGHELLHKDRDFDPFEKHLGLKVIHP